MAKKKHTYARAKRKRATERVMKNEEMRQRKAASAAKPKPATPAKGRKPKAAEE